MSENMRVGGWEIEAEIVTDEQKKMFEAAFDGFVGAGYVPLVYCGSQLISAKQRHMFIARQTLVIQQPEIHVVKVILVTSNDKEPVIETIECII